MIEILILLGSFVALCMIGMPVAYALGLAAIFGSLWIDVPLEAVMIQISSGVNSFSLLAIPFFVLAGAIMAEGGMAVRLVNLARIFVGAVRGGLAVVMSHGPCGGCVQTSKVGASHDARRCCFSVPSAPQVRRIRAS